MPRRLGVTIATIVKFARSLLVLFVLVVSTTWLCADPVEQRDQRWCRYRGPSHGRAQVAAAPAPPFELAWSLDLWDPNDNRILDDHVLYEPEAAIPEGSPLGLGIAWRADRDHLYAFEMGFYRYGKKIALLDRRSGEVLDVVESKGSQPLPNKCVASVHDDPGIGAPLVFFGNFYAGTRMLALRGGQLAALGADQEAEYRFRGHACEGQRWLTHGLYLDGGGLRFTDGPDYGWGQNLLFRRKGEPPLELLEDVAVPRAVWTATDLVLFARGGLTDATAKGTLTWQDYVRVRLGGDKPEIVARRRVTDRTAPTAEMLFEDPPTTADDRSRMINRARNVVHAMALSADGKWVYCHERRTAHTQRIVRRSLEDFRIDGAILPDYLPLVRELGFAGQINPELGVGLAVDSERVYVHLSDRLEAYSLDLKTRLYTLGTPARTLDAHSPFAMDRYVPGTNVHFGCRGSENSLATDGRHVYLTTDTTFQVHDAVTGKRVWSHTFDRLPTYETSFVQDGERIKVRHYGLPGDVILCEDAVYVATHHNQSMIFCFKPKSAD